MLLRLKLSAVTTAICLATASAGMAQDTATPTEAQIIKAKLIEDMGGTDRINLSGKLRMLSQRIPAAACNLNAGIMPEQSAKILAATASEFGKIIKGLEFGDPSLGIIGEESRRKTLAAIAEVKINWEPVGAAADLILDEGSTGSLTQQLADQNGPLLAAAKILVSELTGQYSDPAALLQADAIRIDIAGRQRMLSQRISKDACMMLSGINAEASQESLTKAVSMFDISLTALMEGMPAAGIKASTEPQIVDGLAVVKEHWVKLQPALAALSAGGTLDAKARAAVFEELNVLLVDMNKVVGMYAEVGKQQI